MKISENIKLDIQCFVYFLFKGTMDPRLIAAEFDYLDKLLVNRDFLYNCFEVFAFGSQNANADRSVQLVADYILALHQQNDDHAIKIVNEARQFNRESINYWTDFLLLAKSFCYNSFPNPLEDDYLNGLKGNGSDAVPTFAVWTNVVEVDEHLRVINSTQALHRANERLNGCPSVKFDEWELEQEIY